MGTRPYSCPVCKGKTIVKKGFYPDEPERIKCKACYNGIVFGMSDEYTSIPFDSSRPYDPNYYQFQTNSLTQCASCRVWYSGAHFCPNTITVSEGE